MVKVLGFDLETTSLDTKKARIIEVGAVMFHVENRIWTPYQSFSSLVWQLGDEGLSNETIRITGITDDKLMAEGVPLFEVLGKLGTIGSDAAFICGHNSVYDYSVFNAVLDHHTGSRLIPGVQNLVETPWLCSKDDIRSNLDYNCKKLSHLSLDYGVAVDPKELHRAEADVLLMGKLLTAAGADPLEMKAFRDEPSFFLGIDIPAPWKDDGKGKAEAVSLGFSWQVARGTKEPEFEKTWVRLCKESMIEALQAKANYRIKILRPL